MLHYISKLRLSIHIIIPTMVIGSRCFTGEVIYYRIMLDDTDMKKTEEFAIQNKKV